MQIQYPIRPFMICGALLVSAAQPAFGGFVVPGSQYDINLARGFGVIPNAVFTFDGIDEAYVTTTGVDVVVSESEVPLGDGSSLITIRVLGDEGIFPDNQDPVFWQFGGANALDFVQDVELLTATYASLDVAGDPVLGPNGQATGPTDPWNGSTSLNGISNPDASNWAGWEWQFTVIPSPGGAVLLCFAGLGAVRRRR
ncbi:MAG: hypothetical protein AAFX05_14355 [Planctomycetota bacterium]